jgi:hypothetical protein
VAGADGLRPRRLVHPGEAGPVGEPVGVGLEDRYPFRPSPWHIVPDLQDIAVGEVIADGPDFAAYFWVLSVSPGEHLVMHSIRHPWRGRAVDPRDGGVYLDFSWAFVVRPLDAGHTRLLLRARGNLSPARVGRVGRGRRCRAC